MAPLIVIIGETASGKSALAIELAERFNGEIICADSWTVRRSVNIGTAKPSVEQQRRVPHHLLDAVEPCGDFTAATFKQLALDAIDDITNRQKLPIMAGGTGLYIDGVIFDFGFLPGGDREARKAWEQKSIQELLEIAMYRGISSDGIDVRNKRRLIRLLETGGARPSRQSLRPNTLLVGVAVEKEELKKRIAQRIQQMIHDGLEREAKVLAEIYGWECEALKGIGYKEWRGYFEGRESLEEVITKIQKSTLDLAKRQRTWFKRNKSIHWVATREEAVALVTTFLNK